MKTRLVLLTVISLALIGLSATDSFASYTMTIYSTKDTYIDQKNPTANYGTTGTLSVNSKTAGSQLMHALVQFDLSGIPVSTPDFTLESVVLQLYEYSSQSSTSRTFTANVMTRDWTEGNNTSGSGATWNRYDGTNSWTAAGGDYDVTLGSASATISPTPGAGLWIDWDITDIVQDWLDGVYDNYGLLIKDGAEGTSANNQTDFYSRNSTYAEKPRLIVKYTAIPEASTLGMFGIGFIGLAAGYWKKTSRILKIKYDE
ncbi:MAG: DNRLRE domain-containing protein [Candidatus Omnitrophica bacterium]|nr:DNRLRE domain-containing protein [Candidatus Omnitrophota bacterium]